MPAKLAKISNMTEELSGVTVVIIIGLGVLTFLLLFIFAKRQIMRFALRSRRGPHVPIGHNAKKALKREIERRIDIIPKIISEPKLMQGDPRYILSPGQQVPTHYYRLRAVDDIKTLENEIKKQDPCLFRHPLENFRAFLLATLAAPLNGSGQRLIHQFCDLYEHARHDPNNFGEDEYQAYTRLLLKLVDAAKLLKSTLANSRRSSPNRTPQRRATTNIQTIHHRRAPSSGSEKNNRNLLDPARLRPGVPGLLFDSTAHSEEVLYVRTTDGLTSGSGDVNAGRPTSLIMPLTPLMNAAFDNETSV